jgi:solute carrier family 25 (mitochondrial folate transporter), member 32
LKQQFGMTLNSTQSMPHLAVYFAASSCAGALTLCLTNPIWVLKTRMCLAYPNLALSSTRWPIHRSPFPQDYSNLRRAVSTVYRTEGMRGFYSGFLPGLIGVTHGGIQFMLYDGFKQTLLAARAGEQPSLGTAHIMLLSSGSKVTAAFVTYPYQVIRSRLQDPRGDSTNLPYHGFRDVIIRTFK